MPGVLGAHSRNPGVKRLVLPGGRPLLESVKPELAPDPVEAAHHEQPPVLERVSRVPERLSQVGSPRHPELGRPLPRGLSM
eukprot:9802921-Alexandrium_andersonii.AAC.1